MTRGMDAEDARAALARVEAEQQPAPFIFTGDFAYRNAWTPPTEEDVEDADLTAVREFLMVPTPAERGRDPITDALLTLWEELSPEQMDRETIGRLKAEWLPRLRGMREQLKQEANTDG